MRFLKSYRPDMTDNGHLAKVPENIIIRSNRPDNQWFRTASRCELPSSNVLSASLRGANDQDLTNIAMNDNFQ